MKITPEQIEVFKSLQQTGSGRALAAFFEEMTRELCDIRRMPSLNDAVKEARADLVSLIKAEVIDRLRLSNPDSVRDPNEFV